MENDNHCFCCVVGVFFFFCISACLAERVVWGMRKEMCANNDQNRC